MEASEIQISVNEDEDHKEEEDLNLDQDEKKDDEEKNDEEKNDVLSVSEKEELEVANDTVGDSKQTFSGILIEHLPWLAVAMLGFILLLTAVILMTTGMISKPKINLESINIPSFQGSMRIHSIDNENLKYSAKLKYVGNLAAINLRHKIEPKLKQIYKSSGLDVGSVLVISFKYGGTDSKLEQPVSKRSVQSTDNSSSLIVYHWVYLKQRTTLETDALEDRVKKAVETQPGISVDMDSISVLSLANMTSDQALTVLTQYGFFKEGIQNLNMDVLAKLGIIKGPGDFGLQSENSLSFCPAFQNVSYMSVMPATCLSSSDIYHGMVCSFRCDNDSYMTGSAHRVCLSSGIWSGLETACKKKCPHMLLPTNGELIPYTCKAVDSLVGQMCFLHCPLNYKVFDYTTESQNSGRSVFWECMEEGHWSRSTGICEASCPSINIGSNQQFTSDTCLGSKSGDICYIQCAMGFVLEDGSYMQQVTCGYDGNWNKIPLPCKKTCSNIVPTSNETVTPSLCQENPYHGIQCMFDCTPGFALVGSEVILCNASGVWSDSVPSCRRTCSALEPVQNGMIITIQGSCLVDQPVENSTCELKCDTGFTALSSITKCDNETGEWSVSNQTCLRTCSPLNVPEHGSWNPASCSEEGHHASFNECTLLCDAPYERQGNYTLACDEMTGLWDKQGGLCKARCGSVSAPNNGMILPNSESSCTSNPFAGTKCMFSCDIGFLLRGEHSLMCQADGSWSSVIPSCEERQQFLITQSLDGSMSCLTVSEEEIFKEMHNCSEHIESNRWVLNGTTNIQNAASQLCLSTSSNSNTPTMVTCDENQDNQLFSSSYQYQVMTYNGLFLSVGHRTSRKPIFLDQIHPFYGNADWKFKDVENGMLYSLFGARNNGSCLRFNSTENMDVVPSTCKSEAQVDGTVCSVSCNAGFSLSSTSSSSVQCVRGSWNITSHLKCLPDNGCNPYESTLLKDVTVTPQTCVSESMDEKSVCSFSCGDPLKYLHGVSSVTCKDDGSWSSSTSVACNAYCSTTDLSLAINKSTTYMEGCSSTLIKSGGVCSFQCLSGYILNGTPLVTCLNSGNWDSTPPMCEKRCRPPVLGPLATLSNCTTQKLQNGYTVGTTCSVTCPAGYVAPFGSFIQCQNSGLWNSGGLSKCVVSCPAFLPSTDFHATPSSCSESPSPIGTNCQLTCTSGYLFNGRDFVSSFERTCGSNGLWQGTVAQCVTACPPISTVIDSNLFNYEPLSCMSGPQLVGTRCSKKCRNMDNILGKISELTCTSNGTWLTSEVYSTLDDCVSYCPGLIASIHVQIEPASCTNEMVEPVRNGNLQHVKSWKDYKTIGLTIVVMIDEKMAGHLWYLSELIYLSLVHDGNISYVKSIKVSALFCYEDKEIPAENTTVKLEKCTSRSCTECFIHCPFGMDRIGPGIKNCNGVVDWGIGSSWSSAMETECVARCPPVLVPPYTYVFPTDCSYSFQKEGEQCSFECERGFSLIGPSSTYCNTNGQWSNGEPTCYRMCIGTEILNGKLLCDSVNAQGYEYIPGTRCSYVCDKGFAAHSSSEVTCTARGTWSPEPFCERLQNLFPVIQKIGNYSICLMATKSKEIIGREWLLGFVNTTDGCLEADNNARWHWFGQNNIKHAESGLCLTAEMLQRESMLNLDFCDEGDIRQHWDCDAFRSYRLILKGTDLSMDSSYPLIGPLLEIWTHAKSYWITFNEDLDTFASICSYRLVGTCPKISAPLLIAAPGVCSTDKVSEWQKCDLSCEEDAYLLGGVTATECLPTGVWKELTEVQCVNKCPPISLTVGKILNPSRCTSLKIGHHEVCDLSCDVGYELSNGENSMSLFCENGTWSGENVSCVPRCASQPTAPEGGSVTCSRGVCTFVCDPGYRLNSLKNSVLVECLSAGNDNYSSITCERDNQFIIKSKSTSLSGIYPLCLFLHSSGETKKVACDLNDKALYWRWKNDNLQHVQSERCLLAGSLDNWSNVTSAVCNNDDNQQFTCHNYYYPYHLKPKVTSELFVDFGAASLDAPVILRDGYPPFSGEWLTSDIDGNNQTLCSFKQQGVCAPLSPIIAAVISPVECAESSSAESVCTITCDTGYTTLEGLSYYKLRCLASGLWNSSLSPCIAQSSNEGSCEAPTVSVGLIISPSNCLIQSSLSRGMGCLFSCDPGYHLIGSKVIYCKGGNSWSDAVPICEAYCPRLPNLPGLIRNPEVCSSTQIAVGVNCTENCAEGYSFGDGPNIRACERSGVWTGEIMECQVVCPKLSSSPYLATDDESMIGENRSAVVTTSSCAFGTQLPGSSCSFQCPPTYVAVSGASNVVCLANGTWSSPIPRCIPQNHCPAVSMIGTESVVYERLKDDIAIVPGTAVFVDCAAGYHADGDNQRMCQTNGMWDGEGPTSPACTSLCPPLPVRFLGSILPVECTSQYSREGQSCMLQCIDDAQFSNGNKSLNVICRNGVWSNELPRCISESLTDESEYEAFMMITRSEKTGCLVVNDDDDIVTWNEVLDCNVNEPKHLWKWSQYGGALLNVGRSKCLQPMDKTANITSLVVGDCAQAMENSFICGDPKSSVERYLLYYHPNETWGMAYSKDVVTSAPLGILLHQITIPAIKSYQKFYAGINVHANADINYSEVGDHPVCAYACRGTITQDSKEGYLSSPGYHQNKVFPAYSNCEWTIVGSNDVKISITLLDIDLEGESTSDDPCQFDCIKVFSGPVNDELYWTMLKILTGQNIAAYLPEHGGNSVASVLGNMYIKFSSSGIGQHKGFVISYRFDEIVPPEGCGVVDESLWSSTATSQSPVGRKASIERWPWLVSIRGKDSILNKANHRCTGVLVNDQTVVSSAHCAGFMVKTFAENMTVMLVVGQTSQNAMFVKHHVLERIFVHPKYDYQHRTNDIAVWKLSEPVEFSKTIQPICFPMDGHAIHDVFSSCYAVGWNRLRNGEVVDVLVEYKMNIVTNMLCEKELGIGSQSAFVCSSHDGLDAFGLSRTNFSEPLMCKFRERWYLAGVSSYTHVGTSRALRLYSDVNSHSNWLSKTIFRTSVVSYQSRNLELLQHIF